MPFDLVLLLTSLGLAVLVGALLGSTMAEQLMRDRARRQARLQRELNELAGALREHRGR